MIKGLGKWLPSRAGFLIPLALTAMLLGVTLAEFSAEQLERLEQVTYDWRFRKRGPRKPSEQILVIYVDDDTFSRLKIAGGSPSRAQFARVIDECLERGATVVGVDYVFDAPSLDPADDAALAKAMGGDGDEDSDVVPVVLACNIARGEAGWTMPDQRFLELCLAPGFINYLPDSDGKVRRARYRAERLIQGDGGKLVWTPVNSFALELMSGHLDMAPEEIEASYQASQQVWVLDLPSFGARKQRKQVSFPLPNGLVNFVGPRKSFQTVSFWQVHNGLLPAKIYKDRAVLIGDASTTRAGGDFIHTPFTSHKTTVVDGQKVVDEDAAPGVDYHAASLQTMLEGSFIRRLEHKRLLICALLGTLLLGWLLCWHRMLPEVIVLLPLALAAGTAYAAWFLFERRLLWMEVVIPLTAIGAQFCGGLGLFIYRLRKSRQEITGLFGRYVSKNYVNLLVQKVKEGEDLEQLIAGDRREISVLFSDVRGFTSLSEVTDPGLISRILRRYFSVMIQIVRDQYQGTMDKLLGDGLMAFYNAPLPQEDHALRACKTALAMIAALDRLEIKDLLTDLDLTDEDSISSQLLSKRPLNIGVGINTGPAIVGDLGSETFADYTVLGDAVNLAARLEALNKIYGTSILISEYTHEVVKEQLFCRRVDRVQVKGRKKAVWIFEVMALTGQASPSQQALRGAYQRARIAYEAGDLSGAREQWEKLRESHPHDGPTAFFLEKLAAESATD